MPHTMMMKHRAFALAFAAALVAVVVSQGAAAQGLRPSGAAPAGGGFARPAPGPSVTVPAANAPVSSAQRQADFIVAVVNSEPVTNNEVRSRLARAEAQLAQQGGAMPPDRKSVV